MILSQNLLLERCPHCAVANPNLVRQHTLQTNDHAGAFPRVWAIYVCGRCGGVVSAFAPSGSPQVVSYFPGTKAASEDIPAKPRAFLQQAMDSMHAPAGAIMLAASAVDAMLKLKAFNDGSLYSRIDKAADAHVITADMAAWAHDVRLGANDQRHADEEAPLPTSGDAARAVDFGLALAEIMFVLPSRVQRGMSKPTA